MLLRLEHATKGLSDQITFQAREVFGRVERREAGSFREGVDEFEDEEARESAA